jgi:hypothetical protein
LNATAGGTDIRTLNDGRTFTIVDRAREERELRAAFEQAGMLNCEVFTLGQRFTAITATA